MAKPRARPLSRERSERGRVREGAFAAVAFLAAVLLLATPALAHIALYAHRMADSAAEARDGRVLRFDVHAPLQIPGWLLAAPYGVWQHDLVLLLVPVLATAARPGVSVAGVAALAAVNAVALAMMLAQAESKWYVWFAPAVLLGCWAIPRVRVSAPAALGVAR